MTFLLFDEYIIESKNNSDDPFALRKAIVDMISRAYLEIVIQITNSLESQYGSMVSRIEGHNTRSDGSDIGPHSMQLVPILNGGFIGILVTA